MKEEREEKEEGVEGRKIEKYARLDVVFGQITNGVRQADATARQSRVTDCNRPANAVDVISFLFAAFYTIGAIFIGYLKLKQYKYLVERNLL